MGKKISFILFSIIFLGIFSISFTHAIGEIEDDFEIDVEIDVPVTTPVDGICKDTYQEKNIFQVPSDICISGTFDSTIKTCKGENGGRDAVCTFNIILPPTKGDHIENPTEIIWKWENPTENNNKEPKTYEFFEEGKDIPNEEDLKDICNISNPMEYQYSQVELTPTTSYSGTLIVFDDICDYRELILEAETTKGNAGTCSDTYQDKNIFDLKSDNALCTTGNMSNFKINDNDTGWTWSCDGIDGGDAGSCSANKLFPPIAEEPNKFTTSITWKWKNNDKNGEETPKGVKWFPKIPNQTELDNAPKNSWGTSYTQEGLTPNTSYTGYVVAFDDLGEPSDPIKLTGSTTIPGACSDRYQEKNIFELKSDNTLCTTGEISNFKINDNGTGWTWSCDGVGGDTFSCKANKLSPPVVENPETTTTSIKWKWKNNDKNSKDVEPKNITWFDHEPKEEEKVSTGGLIWNYTQGGLKDNTPYTSYIVAFDDLDEPSEPIKLTGSTKKTPSGGGGGGGYVPPSQPKEPKDEDKIETPKEEEKNDDPTPTKEKPSTPSTPTDPQDPKQEEKPEKSTPVYPIIKHPKRTCEPNELIMETRCIYPNIDFTLNDIQDNFAYKYIYSLASAGIVQGYYDTGLFQPDNSISRSEYLKILFKAFCIEYSETSTQNIPFTDVESENWEAKIIAKALELDIISKENTLFRPHQAISRAESMKLLFKVAGVIPQDVHVGLFEDVPNETWEVKYIQKAYESCIIDGKEIQGNLYFEPYQNTTRAEVAKIIANALMLER